MNTVLLIGAGGFLGSMARFYVSNYFKGKQTGSFPVATFIVNVVGSFVLGYIIGASKGVELFLGVGFLGAFTTFSTFNLESIHLIEQKKFKVLFLYLFGSYAIGIALAFLGIKLAPG